MKKIPISNRVNKERNLLNNMRRRLTLPNIRKKITLLNKKAKIKTTKLKATLNKKKDCKEVTRMLFVSKQKKYPCKNRYRYSLEQYTISANPTKILMSESKANCTKYS